MMVQRRLEAVAEVLGDESVRKALAARRERRFEAHGFAMARGEAPEQAGSALERCWFALETANRSEKAVEKLLADERLDVLLPLRRTLKARRGCRPVAKRDTVDVPLFPGYVFARFVVCDESFVQMLRVDGVRGVVNTRGRPLAIGDKDVSRLKDLSEAGVFDQTHEGRELRKGDKVMIKDGPFAWIEGVVQGYAGTMHVRLLAALFGRAVPVTVDLEQLCW